MASIATHAGDIAAAPAEGEVSLVRLYLLRAMYGLLVVGLGAMIVPDITSHRPLDRGVIASLLGCVWLLAFVGLRYPLQMLPVLFFDMIWKMIWLVAVALPHWQSDTMTPDIAGSVFDCSVGVVFLIAIPWDYAAHHYLLKPGDRWWPRRKASA